MIYSQSIDNIRQIELTHNIYLQLAKNLFYQGRTLYINNFYTN